MIYNLKYRADRLYNENSLSLPVEYSLYPFSPQAIEYLYRISAKNIRNLKKYLNEYWEEFQKNKEVDYVKPDFPNAEDYSRKLIFEQIPDNWLEERLFILLEQDVK